MNVARTKRERIFVLGRHLTYLTIGINVQRALFDPRIERESIIHSIPFSSFLYPRKGKTKERKREEKKNCARRTSRRLKQSKPVRCERVDVWRDRGEVTERQFDRLPRFQISRKISLENFFFVPIGEENKNSREIRIEISARESLDDSSPFLFASFILSFIISFCFLFFYSLVHSSIHSLPSLSLLREYRYRYLFDRRLINLATDVISISAGTNRDSTETNL